MTTATGPSIRDTAPRAPLHVRRAATVALVWIASGLAAASGLSRCPVASWLHHPCPGCGLTRAGWRLLHGDVVGSLAMHPLFIPTVLALGALAATTIGVTLTRGSPAELFAVRAGRIALAAMIAVQVLSIVVWIARMLGALGGPVAV